MKTKIELLVMATICLVIIPSAVFAFGEVTGPVVINVPVGGSGVGMWGLGNNETVKVTLRAEGDASKYLSLPSEVEVPATGIYWVNVTAKIPSDYNVSQGTNITGVMYAVLEGSPGQVQINLQLKKYVYILVEQPQISEVNNQPPVQFMTGLFAFGSSFYIPIVALIVILFGIFYFTRITKGVNK